MFSAQSDRYSVAANPNSKHLNVSSVPNLSRRPSAVGPWEPCIQVRGGLTALGYWIERRGQRGVPHHERKVLHAQ